MTSNMSVLQGSKSKEEMEMEHSESMPEDVFEKHDERYGDDRQFRIAFGPSIDMYGLNGFEESLYGLQVDLDFGTFGKCRGVVQQSEKEGDDLVILWACGPNFDGERFKTSFDVGDGGEIILALYYNDRADVPSWFDKCLDQTVINFMKELASASDGTKIANWKEPYSLVDVVGEDNFDERRWRTTMNRLNDPQAAAC